MIRAGFGLDRALGILSRQSSSATLATAFVDVCRRVRGGAGLAEALGRHPAEFERSVVALVHAGETTGTLESALERAAELLKRRRIVHARSRHALSYPIAVIVLAAWVALGAIRFVAPAVLSVWAGFDTALPAPTRMLIFVSSWLQAYGPLALLGLACLWPGMRVLLRSSARPCIDRAMMQVPGLENVLRAGATARVARTTASALAAGMPFTTALELAAPMSGNRAIEELVLGAVRRVESGEAASVALAEVFPAVATSMVAVGEQTATLPRSFERIAAFYERELEEVSQRVIAIVGPAVTVGAGVLVLMIMWALYMPLFGFGCGLI